jgi:hypothetical protein
MKWPRIAFLLFALIISSTAQVFAGANANGLATLAWDKAGVVRALSRAPSDRFPLFVRLENVPDVNALAIHLAWRSEDSAGTYRILPGEPSEDCGWVATDGALSAFGNDSSYAWDIMWPAGVSGSTRCVAYSIEAPPAALEVVSQRADVM